LLDGVGQVEEFDQLALAQSRLALQMDPKLAEPHATIGFIYTDIGKLAEAEQEFQLAFAANPNYATAYHWHSHVLAATGRLDLALKEIEQAESLDPVFFIILFIRGFYPSDARRYAEAIATLDRAAALRVESFLPLESDRARTLLALGRKEEALATARKVLQDPRLITSGWYAAGEALYVLHVGGAADEAARLAPALLQAMPAGSYQRGYVHCAIGNFAEGLGELAQIPSIVQSRLFWHPMLESVHDTPQFRQLLEKLNAAAEFKVARATLAQMLKEPEAKN
jgi:tetratricopeptide (TPR) repeat protein